ncbi:hypothetical protein [Methylomonas sp. 11b]|uniref:hypothetical protein n=1 Tax=Methylomonas sp. 11b TaxID=1168169 RepID=UPI00047DE33C|nr:hypothetical protein [Methylomonas sp. 11b]
MENNLNVISALIFILKQVECKKIIAAENANTFSGRRKEDSERNDRHYNMLKDCGLKTHIATRKDLEMLIKIVLETGVSGRKALKSYSDEKKKGMLWKKTVARKKIGKVFKEVLKSYEETYLIKSLKENHIYNFRAIIKNTLTGALTELSKQISLLHKINSNNEENQRLRNMISIQIEALGEPNIDWEKVKELRKQNYTTRDLAAIFGCSPSSISKYAKLS